MTRLLAADFMRLGKSRHFRECCVFMAVCGGFMVYAAYYSLCRYGYRSGLEDICFGYANLIGFVTAFFVSMFQGTEYSGGTIRNKLVVGHERYQVYLAALIVNGAAVLLINAVYVAVIFLFGIPTVGFFRMAPAALLMLAFLTVLMDMAYAAVFTLLAMLNHNKASVTAVSILGTLILILVSGYIQSRLNEPKVYEAYEEVTDKGYVITREAEENPYYLAGWKREICVVLNDLLPSGQGLQIENRDTDRAGFMSLYACLTVVVCTGGGIAAFARKDIR